MPMKAAPNVSLRSKLNAIVGREKGRGRREEVTGRRSTYSFYPGALSYMSHAFTRAIVRRRKAPVETKVSVSRVGDDEQ